LAVKEWTSLGLDREAIVKWHGVPAGRRAELHAAAVRALDDYEADRTPFALYLRHYGVTVIHGSRDVDRSLIENALCQALPAGVALLTIQEHRADTEYSAAPHAFDRRAAALFLPDESWEVVPAALIGHAELIVSEFTFLSPGVRLELNDAYRLQRWDRTVLVLPPLRSPFATLDNDALVQMFPRCVWADVLHTTPLAETTAVRDLIGRLDHIASLAPAARRELMDTAARGDAFPIDLMALARNYEVSAMLEAQWQDEDDRVVYYGFWQLFRAAGLRAVALLRGDRSFSNRSTLAETYVQLGSIMLRPERDGERFVIVGDLTFAEQCAASAYNLLAEDEDGAELVQRRAISLAQDIGWLQEVMTQQPDRFVVRPRYGPFVTRRL
jgi:hypothetical protein